MIYFLSKTGSDARFFPQNMPVQWHAEIYNKRFDVFNVIARRKAKAHTESMARVCDMDFTPADLEHDGEAYWMKMIAKESAVTELTVARLMVTSSSSVMSMCQSRRANPFTRPCLWMVAKALSILSVATSIACSTSLQKL
jgi:hypothetical protein